MPIFKVPLLIKLVLSRKYLMSRETANFWKSRILHKSTVLTVWRQLRSSVKVNLGLFCWSKTKKTKNYTLWSASPSSKLSSTNLKNTWRYFLFNFSEIKTCSVKDIITLCGRLHSLLQRPLLHLLPHGVHQRTWTFWHHQNDWITELRTIPILHSHHDPCAWDPPFQHDHIQRP